MKKNGKKMKTNGVDLGLGFIPFKSPLEENLSMKNKTYHFILILKLYERIIKRKRKKFKYTPTYYWTHAVIFWKCARQHLHRIENIGKSFLASRALITHIFPIVFFQFPSIFRSLFVKFCTFFHDVCAFLFVLQRNKRFASSKHRRFIFMAFITLFNTNH